MDIKPCNPYISAVIQKKTLAFPGGSVFKLYYVSLTGRTRPENNDWAHAPFKPEDFEKRLTENPPEGVGFITVFVPITKVFRFAPAGETIMHVKAFRTPDLAPLDLARPDGYTEFACYAEAAISADEYRRWAEARSVEEYLDYTSPFTAGAIADHAKLAAYWK